MSGEWAMKTGTFKVAKRLRGECFHSHIKDLDIVFILLTYTLNTVTE